MGALFLEINFAKGYLISFGRFKIAGSLNKLNKKGSEHYFFDLPQFENKLKDWTKAGHLQEQVSNKLAEWFEQGLQQWDISRDSPYFGFKIPGTWSERCKTS